MRVLILLLLISNSCYAGKFFQSREEGWFWYKEKQEEIKKSHKTRKQIVNQVDYDKQAVEESLKVAYENPTEENIKDYIQKKNKILDKSYNFGLMLQKVSILNPTLDLQPRYPTNSIAKGIYTEEKELQEFNRIKKLSREYGLFYIFKGNCRYCHAFAPTVKRFAAKFNWNVLAISADGDGVADFPNFEKDNGIIKKFGIEHFPALIAVSPKSKKVLPISLGLISEEELFKRISLITREGVGA